MNPNNTCRRTAFLIGSSLCLLYAGPTYADIAKHSLFPARDAKSVAQCQSIFAKLEEQEKGILVAQATPKGKTELQQEAALADELSDLLQACSYDGSAIKVSAKSLNGASSSDGEAVVKTIMRFTGLPQNFKVIEGPVPNAAAMIVLGPDKLPVRVIAYNARFMDQVRQATKNNDWASISVMAHEIGHHLSGHTLMAGGSQPPIELEADKFSGFVLQKMGATLDHAQTAISTLVPEGDGPTHPGRSRRLAAILDGWTESCQQRNLPQCAGTEVAVAVQPHEPSSAIDGEAASGAGTSLQSQPNGTKAHKPVSSQDLAGLSRQELESRLLSAMDDLSKPGADIDAVGRTIDALNAAIATSKDATVSGMRPIERANGATPDRFPKLDAAITPSKFDRFVYDEFGVIELSVKEKLAKAAYDFAASNNIEIVTIVAKDLQGRSADQFAQDAMRQLRVGKLEVGNGAVLVFAPEARQVGIALGAGLLVYYRDTSHLRDSLNSILTLLNGGMKPSAAGELLANTADRIMRDARFWEWNVRFQSIEEMISVASNADKALETSGATYDPEKDPTARKLARVRAKIVTMTPDRTDKVLDVNDIHEANVGPAMHVRTSEGRNVLLYVNPIAAALMPVPLEAGKTYSFVARESFLKGDTPQFDLISYDLVGDGP